MVVSFIIHHDSNILTVLINIHQQLYHCDSCGRDRMVVEYTTTCTINASHSVTGATSGTGTVYPSGTTEFTPDLNGVRVARYTTTYWIVSIK
jgi:hypothetical protein